MGFPGHLKAILDIPRATTRDLAHPSSLAISMLDVIISSEARFLLQGPNESIWLLKFPKCRFRLHKHQRLSSSVCLFLIRFTIPTQAGNVLHHHIILKLKLPYFPLSRPQKTLAFPCFHLYCALSNSKNNLIISLIHHNRLR